MAYVKRVWVDEALASTPPKFKISQSTDGDVATDATIELVTTVSTPGTAVNASNLNHLETGLETAAGVADTALANAATAQAAADNAHADAATAQADATTALANAAAALSKATKPCTSVHYDWVASPFASSSNSYVDVTNATFNLTLTDTGVIVAWATVCWDATAAGQFPYVCINIDGVDVTTMEMHGSNTDSGTTNPREFVTVLALRGIASTGVKTVKLRTKIASSGQVRIYQVDMMAIAL